MKQFQKSSPSLTNFIAGTSKVIKKQTKPTELSEATWVAKLKTELNMAIKSSRDIATEKKEIR